MSIMPDFPLEAQLAVDPMEQAVDAMTDCQERVFTTMRRMLVRASASNDDRFRAEFASLSATISELCDHFGAVMEQTEMSLVGDVR